MRRSAIPLLLLVTAAAAIFGCVEQVDLPWKSGNQTPTQQPTDTPTPIPSTTSIANGTDKVVTSGEIFLPSACYPVATQQPTSIVVVSSFGIGFTIQKNDLVLLHQATDPYVLSSGVPGANSGIAGEFRFALVSLESTSGDGSLQTLTLSSANVSIATGGRAQLCRVPMLRTLVVKSNGLVAGLSWNGAAGGIIAVHATNLVFEGGSRLSADGLGFRRGQPSTNTAGPLASPETLPDLSCSPGTVPTPVLPPVGNPSDVGGAKAEGLAGVFAAAKGCGRAPFSTGGGGGNPVKAGGGGGANGGGYGTGRGGNAASASGASSVAATAGGGGFPAPTDATHKPVLMFGGGGGGGGLSSPIGAAGRGGNGGGAVFLFTTTLKGSTNGVAEVDARGFDGDSVANGGAGGGGAGGTVLIRASTWSDSLTIDASGGAAGSVTNGMDPCTGGYGVGGSGGGGLVDWTGGGAPTAHVLAGAQGIFTGSCGTNLTIGTAGTAGTAIGH